jgi:hypothetical protein
MGLFGTLRKRLLSLNGRTLLICLALSAFLWLLRTMEGDRTVTYAFAIELVGVEASTGLQADLIDSTAKAEVMLSPGDHLLGRWSPTDDPIRLKVEGLRTPRTEVPSEQLSAEIEHRLGNSARVRSISPATLAINVRRGNPKR